MKVFQKNKYRLRAFCLICVIIILWELVTRQGLVPNYILPPFSQVVYTTWIELTTGSLFVMVGRTLLVLIEALAISFLLSAIIVFICQKSKTFLSFYNIIAPAMNSIPSMALLPLVIMWIGIDNAAIVTLVVHSVLWTFTIYLLKSISTIPKEYREFTDNINLSIFRKIKDVFFPAVLPHIVAGLKIACSRAWRSIIGAEIIFGAIGTAGGLGYFININRQFGNMDKVLSGVLIIVLIGLIMEYAIFFNLDKLLKKWGMKNE